MKKIVLAVFLFLAFSSASFAQREQGLTGRFIPEDGKILLFAGQNNKDSGEFVKIMKKTPAGFMFYTALSDLNGLEEEADFGSGVTSGSYLVKKYPGAALQIGLYLVNSLDDVISGELDKNIEKLAVWIKSTHAPVFLRIGYEFDYPENGYEPEKYVAAFRYIVDKMDSFNVVNAAYVWHSYASLNPRGIEAWYPGDDYVDWCAISYFANPQWIPMFKFAQRHSKPLMIAESAPMLGHDLKEENKTKWYNKLFRFAEIQNIKALCYINCNWDIHPQFQHWNWGNSKINASSEIEKIFKNGVSDKRFIWLKDMYSAIHFQKSGGVLIIFCHPDNKDSFNAAILDIFKKTLDGNNVRYTVRDLYGMDFNPVLSKKDWSVISKKEFPKEIEKERELIKNADTVVFIYPVWWSGAPAMLKGYIDRVFSPGSAFNVKNTKMHYSIKYKNTIVINTMAMNERTFKETGADDAFKLIYDDMLFSSFGLKVKEHKYFYSLYNENENVLRSYLEEVEKIANSIK